MAKIRNDTLEDKINLVFSSLGELQEKIEKQEQKAIIPLPKISPIKKHFDALIENALQSPHSTLSGLAVGACFLGAKIFPEYASTLQEFQVFATGLTGVTAGNAILSKPPVNTAIVPKVIQHDTEEYG